MTTHRRRRDLAANTVWSAIDELMLVTGSIVGLLVLVPLLNLRIERADPADAGS